MGKRSAFARIERDAYDTIDPRAIAPLLPHIPRGARYAEPCAGNGSLIELLQHTRKAPVCVLAADIAPRNRVEGEGVFIRKGDALALSRGDLNGAAMIITNPPWIRPELHRMIAHFAALAPTWLLFDAGWAYTKQSAPFRPLLRKIVAVGRLRWIPGTESTGKDDCAWYLFADARHFGGRGTQFYGRRG